METLTELYQAPDFQELDYAGQQQVKRRFFESKVATSRDYQALSPEDKERVFYRLMDTAPAIRGLGGIKLTPEEYDAYARGEELDQTNQSAYKKAIYLHDAALRGDKVARDQIKNFIAGRTAENQSLIMQVGMGIVDMLDGEEDVKHLQQDRAELNKFSDYLKSALNSSEREAVAALETVASIGVQVAESIPLNMFLIGNVGKAGLLTKGIFGSLESTAANMLPGIGRTALTTLGYETVEAIGQGFTEVLRSLPMMLNDGTIKGNKELFSTMTENFGQGVVLDVASYYAMKGFFQIGKPFVNQWRKMRLSNSEDLARVAKDGDWLDADKFPEFINMLTSGKIDQGLLESLPEAARADAIKTINKTATLARVPSVDLNTPDGFTKYAMAAQHDVDFIDGKIILSQFDKPVFTASSYREAANYLSNYTKTLDGNKFVSDLMDALRGSGEEMNLRVEVTSKVNIKKLPTKAIVSSLKPDYTGKVNLKNVKDVSETLLERANAVDAKFNVERVADFATFQKKAQQFGGNQIIVPAKLQTEAELKAFGDYYNQKLTQLTRAYGGDVTKLPSWDTVQGGISSFDTANPASLQSMVRQFGGELNINGANWELKVPGNAPQIFHSAREAERAIADFRVATIGVTEDEVVNWLSKSGKTVKKELNPHISSPENPIYQYNVYGHGGIIEAGEDSIQELVTKHPQYMPKLPAFLAPEMSFVGNNQKLRVMGDLMYGTEQDIRKALDSYASNEAKFLRHVEHAVSKNEFGDEITADILQASKYRFVVEAPEMGFRKTFSSAEQAKKFISKDLQSFSTLEELANERGIKIVSQKSGEFIATDKTGKTTIIHSRDEFNKLLKEYPDPEGASEFIGYNTYISEDMVQEAADIARRDFERILSQPKAKSSDLRKAWHNVLSYGVPMHDTLQNIAKDIGNSELTEDLLAEIAKKNPTQARRLKGFGVTQVQTGLGAGKRLVTVESRKAEDIMDRFLRLGGKQLSSSDSSALIKILESSESKWATVAKTLGIEWTPEKVRLLKNTKSFLDYYGKYFGIDLQSMFTNYAPRIRKTLRQLQTDPKLQEQYLKSGKQQIIHSLFGAEPDALKTVEFFARHGRLEAFLTDAGDTNLVRSLKFYIDNGMHEKYMRPLIEDAKAWFEQLPNMPNVNIEQTALLESWFKAISGEALNGSDLIIANTSSEATRLLAQWMRTQTSKLAPTSNVGKFFEGVADELESRGALEMMNSAVTYATLGARPLRGLYNMMQFNNTIGVYGHYADEAMAEFMQGGVFNTKKAQAIVNRYMEQGVMTDKVFASGHTRPHVNEGLLELSMRNQQNSEYWTRGATALTIEKNFDDVFPYYADGRIDLKTFLKESNIDFLDDDMQKEVIRLIADGKAQAAKQLYMREGVNILMGDYDAANYPMSFKGAVGKLFGRFGVYPVNQVAMYRRMATQGTSTSKKIFRALRFLTVTTATYEAFRMVGIDYNGFLAWDPFTFSGGPLFKLGQDMLNSSPLAGKDVSMETKLARQNVIDSWRLMVPFSSQAQKMLDAYESGSQGEIHKALIEAMSGSYTADSLLTTPAMR